ncbi:MAG: hypothetical protein AAB874_03165 [Patescibacteria group bacterium]
MNKYSFFLGILTLGVLTAGIAGWFTVRQKELRIRAVKGCMTTSTYKLEDKVKGVTTVEPFKDAYVTCIKEKGY